MRKFVKISLIIALVLLLLGGVLFVAGIAMGATRNDFSFPFIVENEDGYDWETNMDDISAMLNENPKEVFEYKVSEVKALDVDVKRAYVRIAEGESKDTIRVKSYSNLDKVSYDREDQELSVKRDTKRGSGEKYPILIEIPSSVVFDEADISIGAGMAEMDAIQANELSLDTGMGTLDVVGTVKARTAELNIGMGSLTVGLLDAVESDIETGMGRADIRMVKSIKYYNTLVDCGMGSVDVGDASYSGIAAGGNSRAEAGSAGEQKELDIKCGMGSVTISFEEQ